LRKNTDDTLKLLPGSTSVASSVPSRLVSDDRRRNGSDECWRLKHEPRRNVSDDGREKKHECVFEWKRHEYDE
jgi:hypothetical protein